MRSSTTEARARFAVWAILGVVLAAVILAGGWHLFERGAASTLPTLGLVPAFTLVGRDGTPVSSRDLAGRPWVADFIFTRCQGICPALSARMALLLRRLADRGMTDATAVSISVDPEHDSPEVLREYAERFGADPERWHFLTGETAAIERLVRDGFRLSLASLPEAERQGNPEPITHSDRFVLVDDQLRIRGYYHGTDDDDLARLERDLAQLR